MTETVKKNPSVGVYVFGLWCVFTGIWYLTFVVMSFIPFLANINFEVTKAIRLTPLMFIAPIIAISFIETGKNFIRLMPHSIYLMTAMCTFQFFYGTFRVLIAPSEPVWLNMNIGNLLYLIWFLIFPILVLVFVTRRKVKEQFKKVTT